MKAYKGFDKNMQCRGSKFEENKTYETDEAKLCESGFHACEYPLDCFSYYPPSDSNYHEVELDATEEKHDDDTKRVGKRIKIGAKLSIAKMVEASVQYIAERIDRSQKESNTGDRSAATNTGDRSAATNTGDWSAATNTGNWSAAKNTGDQSAATNTGDWSAAKNTGCQSAATNTGYQSAATNTGDQSAATNTGLGGVALVTGYESKARGAIGSAICICERGEWDGETYPLLAIKAAIIDGEALKPYTWYTLKDGEFVEAGDDD